MNITNEIKFTFLDKNRQKTRYFNRYVIYRLLELTANAGKCSRQTKYESSSNKTFFIQNKAAIYVQIFYKKLNNNDHSFNEINNYFIEVLYQRLGRHTRFGSCSNKLLLRAPTRVQMPYIQGISRLAVAGGGSPWIAVTDGGWRWLAVCDCLG